MTQSSAQGSTAPSTRLATWLVGELVARGVTDAVLCPGSRNAPLSFALAAAPDREELWRRRMAEVEAVRQDRRS